MTMLSVIQDFAARTGIPVPTFVIGTTDSQVLQLQGVLREVLDELTDRWTWQQLTFEATFTSSATEDQGSLTSLAPSGFDRIIDDTLFNRTEKLPIFGQVNQRNWQAIQAVPTPGPRYQYRIRGNRLLFTPAPPAGHTIAFEYASNWAVGGAKQYPTADSDTFVFPDKLILAGLRAFWKREKGLDYAEEMRAAEEMATNMAARGAPRKTIDMGAECPGMVPGIFVTPGNWSL